MSERKLDLNQSCRHCNHSLRDHQIHRVLRNVPDSALEELELVCFHPIPKNDGEGHLQTGFCDCHYTAIATVFKFEDMRNE